MTLPNNTGDGIRNRVRPWTKYKPIFRSIVGSIILGLIVFILVVGYAPDSVAYSPNNYGWNGLHSIYSTYSMQTVTSLSNLSPGPKSVLLIIEPVSSFSEADSLIVQNFVQHGGTLVVGDSIGTANSLLQGMGIGIRVDTNLTVADPLYNWKAPLLPVSAVPPAEAQSYSFLSGVEGIAMDEPSPLVLTRGSDAIPVGFSSPLSIEVGRSGLPSPSNSFSGLLGGSSTAGLKAVSGGPFPLIAVQKMGNGMVIVAGDSQIFTNPIWTEANNRRFIDNLLSNSLSFLDSSHWQANTAAAFKGEIAFVYGEISQFPLNYLFTLGVIEVALLIVPLYNDVRRAESRKRISTGRIGSTAVASGEEGKGLASSYNQQILDRVRKDRDKYGIR